MDSQYFHDTAYVELIIRSLQLPPEQLLKDTGLNEDTLAAQEYVSAKQLKTIFENVLSLSPPAGWTAQIGNQLNINAHGPLGFAALSAPTLGDALQVMADYHGARVTSISTELKTIGKYQRFSATDLTGDELYAQLLAEIVLKVIASLIETIVGHDLDKNASLHFIYDKPDHAQQLENIYKINCQFNSTFTGIKFPASWRHIKSPLYDESTYRINIAKCKELISKQHNNDRWDLQIENLLEVHFETSIDHNNYSEPPSLTDISESLFVTPRTLIRRLKYHNTSYKELLRKTRMSFSATLLKRAQYSVAQIATVLGYKESANFIRAFKRWSGITPAQWRKQNH